MSEWMWLILDRTSILITFVSFIIGVVNAAILLSYRRQRKYILDSLRNNRGTIPGILSVAISPDAIHPQVVKYVSRQPWAKERKFEEEEVHIREKGITSAHVDKVIGEVRAARARLAAKGCDVLHLFYRGPLAMALMIGAELGNGVRVHVYHLDSTSGEYQDWGVLNRRLL